MKPTALLAGALLLAAVQATAAFQSAQLLPDNRQPQYPVALSMEGITRGRALVSASIDATGRVTDTLVLAYTNDRFAHNAVDVLKDWRFAPARLDGEAVPVQTEILFDYTLTGAVITTNICDHFLFDRFENAGDHRLVYQPGDARRLDAVPVKLEGAAPSYATLAEKEGVRGHVRVRFYIDETGAVRQPAIASPAHPYLAEQAVAAVRTWKFRPATERGRPVLIAASQDFAFGQ